MCMGAHGVIDMEINMVLHETGHTLNAGPHYICILSLCYALVLNVLGLHTFV